MAILTYRLSLPRRFRVDFDRERAAIAGFRDKARGIDDTRRAPAPFNEIGKGLSNSLEEVLHMKHRFVMAAVVAVVGATGAYAAAQTSTQRTIGQQKIEQRLDKRFEKLDLNHDGVLSKDELHQGVEARMAKVQQRVQTRIDARFAKADKNQDGVISRDEWTGQPARFDRLDTNHDGALSKDEIRSAFARRMARRTARRLQNGR